MSKFRLRLYVTGRTPQSQRAIDNLRRICEAELAGHYEIEVIDVLEHPALAENEKKIVAELAAVQGKKVDIGGYFKPEDAKAGAVMRPSATFNSVIASAA